MTTKTETKAKADRSKPFVASEDTIIEGRPVRKDAPVPTKNMTDDSFQSYVDAGLLKPEKDDAADKTDQVLEEAAKAIDKSEDKRTEK